MARPQYTLTHRGWEKALTTNNLTQLSNSPPDETNDWKLSKYTQSPSGLLKLPAELHLKILEPMCAFPDPITAEKYKSLFTAVIRRLEGFSKKIRGIAEKSLYLQNTFLIRPFLLYGRYKALLPALQVRQRNCVCGSAMKFGPGEVMHGSICYHSPMLLLERIASGALGFSHLKSLELILKIHDWHWHDREEESLRQLQEIGKVRLSKLRCRPR
ncbi:hypothetical protein BDV96DRAFT_660684 [Lophiotrema nucula]|uniref:Uncharacterized protein n=1 Tax=Lophiotrema nucula TaxID=690887 RepID=A0A6A5Z7H8_9PLEO|nr:hypothetical protein BDV96DRAFT_660684 [Lophiotrema nucula]